MMAACFSLLMLFGTVPGASAANRHNISIYVHYPEGYSHGRGPCYPYPYYPYYLSPYGPVPNYSYPSPYLYPYPYYGYYRNFGYRSPYPYAVTPPGWHYGFAPYPPIQAYTLHLPPLQSRPPVNRHARHPENYGHYTPRRYDGRR